MGLILVTGLTNLWPLSIGFAIFYLWKKQNEIRIPQVRTFIPFGILAAIFAVSAAYSPASGIAIYQAASVLLAPIIAVNIRSLHPWISILAIVQIVIIASEYFFGSAHRPSALNQNGSALGIYALMALTPLNAFVLGLSLSRTALLGLGIFAVLRNSRLTWILLAVAIVTHLTLQVAVDPDRLTISNVQTMAQLRVDAIDGSTEEQLPKDIEVRDRELRWFGYGYGGYVLSTGKIQPHNIYILSVWELGLLAIPFWITIAWLLFKSRNPYMAVPALLALNVDEWYTQVEGIFFLIAWHLLTSRLPVGLTLPLQGRKLGVLLRRGVRQGAPRHN